MKIRSWKNETWEKVLEREEKKPYMAALRSFLEEERRQYEVYPPADRELAALNMCPLGDVRVVVLGQDPYHTPGYATGLSFSSGKIPPPPSLEAIMQELAGEGMISDWEGFTGNLTPWAARGALLLNTILTVRCGEAKSHQGVGWEEFTEAVIRAVNREPRTIGWLLMGREAQRTALLRCSVSDRHAVVCVPHPSPLSRGFSGSRPFSRLNDELVKKGAKPFDWSL